MSYIFLCAAPLRRCDPFLSSELVLQIRLTILSSPVESARARRWPRAPKSAPAQPPAHWDWP